MIRKNWNRENIINYIENEIGYTFVEFKKFNKSGSIVTVKCNEGHIYTTSFNSLRKGHKCRKCSGSMKHTLEEVREYLKKYGYLLLSEEYINNKQKLKIQCPHGHILHMRFDKFANGIRCSSCHKSNGEQEIERILEKYNLSYKYQHYYEDCRDKKPMPFDFYLPDYNVCIEFDGEQHYKRKFSMSQEAFENIKMHDQLKTQYCKTNNISLIRISYKDFYNIEKILIEELNLK